MSTPTSDSAAIRQTLRALKAAGVTPSHVEYGDDDFEDVRNDTEQATIDAIMAVDDAYLIVTLPDVVAEAFVRFVMGNDPEEVICDYSMSLDPIIDPLMRGWWA